MMKYEIFFSLVCTISRANHTRRTSRSSSRLIAGYSEC